MGKAQALCIGDVRAVFYLLNELRDLGAQPQLWKRHMLCELCRLIGGQVGISVQTAHAGAVDLATSVITDIGWAGEKERLNWINYCRRNDLSVDPSRAALTRLMAFGRPFVRTREQLCPDRCWYANDHVQITRKESDVDNFIFSYRLLLNPQRHHWLYLMRPWDDIAFMPRQRRLVRLFHDELGRILEKDAARSATFCPLSQLSPRLRETLNLLSRGLSEKQVARNLCCSNHTIHGYVKELHKRLNVSNRVELLMAVNRQRQLAQRVLQL
jgi:DNA-binding CsgD family transcriptional regulator